ncbi:MAG TPA: hypothetical protein VJ724_06105 [Tahibacter sp.]|nr:hypothetical protein [Tahibacter sp.]
MNEPMLLAVPALMILDYLLTIAGARLHDDGYGRHFMIAHYELNPAFQRVVAARRWFSARHLALVVLFAVLLVAFDQWLLRGHRALAAAFAGALVTIFVAVNARHLSNLAIFAYVRRHPGSLSGSVRMSHLLVLWMSAAQTLLVIVPVAVVAATTRHPFALGAFAGSAAFALAHLVWYRRAQRSPQGQRDDGAEHEEVHERVGDRPDRP